MVHWRTLRSATWLGWQIESNWATPSLFALYVVVKPLAGSMLLVCMYCAARAASAAVAPGFLPFLYIGSACFMVIGGVTFGMSNAVVTDRDSYGMLKFVRISPARMRSYLIGRGLARGAQASIGALLTVGAGLIIFPDLRAALPVGGISWGWLALYLALGPTMLAALGLILAGAVLNMARYGMFLSEGVAGTLCLLCGAVFPIGILPTSLQPISMALPPTYWLEGMRRALLGSGEIHSPLSALSHGQLALALAVSSLALAAAAHFFFRWSEKRAWRLGRYDEVAGN